MSDPKPLDEKFYLSIGEKDIAFLKQQIGIQDDAELKQHILAVQAEAYAVFPYTCIRHFMFAMSLISQMPAYGELLKLGKERKDAIFLDLGCCFGSDVRKAVADGYPVRNVIASDIQPAFWDLGHKLFRSTPETFSVPFVGGDAMDPANLDVVPPFTKATAPKAPVPALKTLTSLNPLRGHVSAIHASSLYHLFSEDGQLHLSRAIAGLLSPEPGSMIFGLHIGLPEKGMRSALRSDPIFGHSDDSWKELWDGEVFEKGTTRVESRLIELPRENLADLSPADAVHMLLWSVTRL